MNKEQLPTPSLLVNLQVLQKNVQDMAALARKAGVSLRPHIKTHKNKRIARIQMEAGAAGITCATVSEAEVMAAAGIGDILIAYPLYGDFQLRKVAELNRRCRLTVAFDSAEAAQRLNRLGAERGMRFKLSMIINTGGERDGVLPTKAAALAEHLRPLANLDLVGVLTHEGHVHRAPDTPSMCQLAKEAGAALVFAADALRNAGFNITAVSSGTTPPCQAGVAVEGVTEWRPGTYVFNDLMQMKFVAQPENCALTVLAMVVSHPAPDRYILDAGSKVFSEAASPTYGHGLILAEPRAKLARLSEEHGVVLAPPGSLRLGQRVEVIPVHVCTAVNLSDGFYVQEDAGKWSFWPTDARGLVW